MGEVRSTVRHPCSGLATVGEPQPSDRSQILHSDQPAALARLNLTEPDAANAAFRACCGSGRWAHRMTLHRPYPDLGSLLAAADEAAYDLTPTDLGEALAEEATVPLSPRGSLSAHTALRAAHAAYETRFGHVFVQCLDGLRPDELLGATLAGIRERLDHEPDEERVVAAGELRRIVRGRLVRLVGAMPGFTHACGIDHT